MSTNPNPNPTPDVVADYARRLYGHMIKRSDPDWRTSDLMRLMAEYGANDLQSKAVLARLKRLRAISHPSRGRVRLERRDQMGNIREYTFSGTLLYNEDLRTRLRAAEEKVAEQAEIIGNYEARSNDITRLAFGLGDDLTELAKKYEEQRDKYDALLVEYNRLSSEWTSLLEQATQPGAEAYKVGVADYIRSLEKERDETRAELEKERARGAAPAAAPELDELVSDLFALLNEDLLDRGAPRRPAIQPEAAELLFRLMRVRAT